MKHITVVKFMLGFCVFAQGASAWSAGWGQESGNEEKPAAEKTHTKKRRAPTAKDAVDTTALDSNADLILRLNEDCYVTSFESKPGEIISCTEPLSVKYTKRNCRSNKLLEKGSTAALISCEDKKSIDMRFRNGSDQMIHAKLRVQRVSNGKLGFAAKYKIESANYEESSMLSMLQKPDLEELEGEVKPEESPLKFKFSGFAWVEHERSKRFGYDAGVSDADPGDNFNSAVTAQPNFDSNVAQPSQNNTNFFANFNFELSRDKTSMVSILEVGEMYFGDYPLGASAPGSGGSQGGRSTSMLEVRNLYLNHELNDAFTVRGGLITTISDPRSFVFNDHLASLQSNYKTDLAEGLIWYGNARKNRVTGSLNTDKDEYLGISGSLKMLSGINNTLFFVRRTWNGETIAVSDGAGGTKNQNGNSHYYWAGGTFDFDSYLPISAQATFIYNWGTFSGYDNTQDKLNSYLADVKLGYSWAAPQVNFTLEGLATPGATDVVDATTGSPNVGKRKGFMSPVGSTYLMTIATSDGVDDAPGTPKQSTIASLSNPQGLRLAVFTASANLTKRLTGFARYGKIKTAVDSTLTNSSDFGQEYDFGAIYQVSPSTTLQLDYGRFMPGDFFREKARQNRWLQDLSLVSECQIVKIS